MHGAYRSSNRTRTISNQLVLKESMYHKLRLAYNCFVRLLDLDYAYIFKCSECGPDPKILVMDGLSMGGRKDLVNALKVKQNPNAPIEGSTLEQQLLVRNKDTRKLLASYATLSKGGRYTEEIQQMSASDYETLCDSLSSNKTLQELIKEAGNKCPASLRLLIGELSRDNATCGMLQIAGDSIAYDILTEIANGDGSNLRRTVYDHMDILQEKCSILTEFLLAECISNLTIVKLLKDILKSVKAPFIGLQVHDEQCYGPINESNHTLEFYPNHPLHQGDANYDADNKNEKKSNGCRKQSKKHRRLNPGLFTMFCPHSICIGFQLMVDAESPRIAFETFMRRFKEIPSILIYDNACNLHRYVLKREPVRFQNCKFLVDRMHWSNHVGCSLGYSMDQYEADEAIKEINSQVCEQANRDLRRMSTPFAFMSPENVIQHTKIFLALRNMDKDPHA